MSATKPADLTLAIQKATEGFTAIMYRPTDNDLIEIRQLLAPVLMKTKYDELTLTHNLSEGRITPERLCVKVNSWYLVFIRTGTSSLQISIKSLSVGRSMISVNPPVDLCSARVRSAGLVADIVV